MTDVKIFTFFTQVRRPQAHREQRAAQRFEDLRHGLAGRQLAPAMLAAQAAIARSPLVPGAAQLADNGSVIANDWNAHSRYSLLTKWPSLYGSAPWPPLRTNGVMLRTIGHNAIDGCPMKSACYSRPIT